MKIKKNWKKIFTYMQESGWCGPAVIHMVMRAAGIRLSQKEIAKDIYMPWWGTNHEAMYSYLTRFFNEAGFKFNANLSHISEELKKGNLVVVDWWDDIDSADQDGHYSVVFDYDSKKGKIILGDPSGDRGIWEMTANDFKNRWYDFLDVKNTHKIEGWMLWINPRSKRSRAEIKKLHDCA